MPTQYINHAEKVMPTLTIYSQPQNHFYHGEVIEDKPSYWVIRVTHAASIRSIADKKRYQDAQYPDGIRTFYKAFSRKAYANE